MKLAEATKSPHPHRLARKPFLFIGSVPGFPERKYDRRMPWRVVSNMD
jgi:hypothetical protein